MTNHLPEKRATSSEILLYQTEDGRNQIEVRLEDNTVWLSQSLMAELFQTTQQNISLHIKNIFEEGELDSDSVVKEYLTTAADRKSYSTYYYNLDVIISVGYRVRSHRVEIGDVHEIITFFLISLDVNIKESTVRST